MKYSTKLRSVSLLIILSISFLLSTTTGFLNPSGRVLVDASRKSNSTSITLSSPSTLILRNENSIVNLNVNFCCLYMFNK